MMARFSGAAQGIGFVSSKSITGRPHPSPDPFPTKSACNNGFHVKELRRFSRPKGMA